MDEKSDVASDLLFDCPGCELRMGVDKRLKCSECGYDWECCSECAQQYEFDEERYAVFCSECNLPLCDSCSEEHIAFCSQCNLPLCDSCSSKIANPAVFVRPLTKK